MSDPTDAQDRMAADRFFSDKPSTMWGAYVQGRMDARAEDEAEAGWLRRLLVQACERLEDTYPIKGPPELAEWRKENPT